jgi:hypothetical protein
MYSFSRSIKRDVEGGFVVAAGRWLAKVVVVRAALIGEIEGKAGGDRGRGRKIRPGYGLWDKIESRKSENGKKIGLC